MNETKTFTLEECRAQLDRFGGVLRSGKHAPPNGECQACIEEFVNWLHDPRKEAWSDAPKHLPDLRPLNDSARWKSDQSRTDAMLPLIVALSGWPTWTVDRKTAWSRGVALRVIREILPIALRAAKMEGEARACEGAKTLDEARALAWDANAKARAKWSADADADADADTAYAADAATAYAAYAAAYAADAAAAAAAAADAERPLLLLCQIMCEEAEKSR